MSLKCKTMRYWKSIEVNILSISDEFTDLSIQFERVKRCCESGKHSTKTALK